jgi:ferredoxin
MATIITQECINCGACEPECPNTAIYQGGVEFEHEGKKSAALQDDIFYIVPEKCTECVGFFDYEACAAVCPVDCCVTDPARPETEEVLFLRAKALHPGKEFPSAFPSRFSPGHAGEEGASVEGGTKPAAVATAASPATSPTEAKPAVAAEPAAAKKAAASPAATKASVNSVSKGPSAPNVARVERAIERPAKPLAAGKPSQSQPGELTSAFDEILAQARSPRLTPSATVLRAVLVLASPLLGALPHPTKKVLEAAAGPRAWFSAQMSTALNVVLNFLLYPLFFYILGVFSGLQPFTEADKSWIILGVLLATLETLVRLRDGIFRQIPATQMSVGASFYGVPMGIGIRPILSRLTRFSTSGQVPVEGFYGKEFEAKRERERRYGEVYVVEEFDRGYYVRMELPRKIPPSAAREELSMGDVMPDYDLSVSVGRDAVTIRGSVVDPELRAVCGISPSFPADFRTQIPLGGPLDGFRQKYGDKVLELAVLKAEV